MGRATPVPFFLQMVLGGLVKQKRTLLWLGKTVLFLKITNNKAMETVEKDVEKVVEEPTKTEIFVFMIAVIAFFGGIILPIFIVLSLTAWDGARSVINCTIYNIDCQYKQPVEI